MAESSPAPLPEELVISDDPIAQLYEVERRERKAAFAQLRARLREIELLGTDTPERESFHQLYHDGGPRFLYFRAFFERYVGRVIRVIINDEARGLTRNHPDECYIYDYAASLDVPAIASHQQVVRRGHYDEKWPCSDTRAPILYRRSDRLEIVSGPNYARPVFNPDGGHRFYTDVMDRRIWAEELLVALNGVNDVSLVPGMVLGNESLTNYQ